ncbi:MAG: MoaF-related domain-containing protein [Mitsuokella sp.]|uniref:MoaF-related domain-containing protein n=1 Tax=Mitsuokella sp. TaxID=2049034 RepID=UPI003D7DB57C
MNKTKRILATMLVALSFSSICAAADVSATNAEPSAKQVSATQAAIEQSKIAAAAEAEKQKQDFFKRVDGKTVAVHYDSGFQFNIDYPEVGVLQWTPTSSLTLAKSDKEHYEVQKVGTDIYSINWVESKGIVVSQILNFKTHKAYAYMTWNKEGERGNRASIFHKGSFKLVDKK